MTNCPCHSTKPYATCCEPYHQGALPENALTLMRSRYSAYALNLPDYIVETTHPASPQYSENKFDWKRNIAQFSKQSTFEKLEILDFKENEALAVVTFTAYISQQGHNTTFTEKSTFEKQGGRWLYRTGQLAAGRALHLIAKQPLMVLPLAYYGDPILQKAAAPVPAITPQIRALIDAMSETLLACDGSGLAAPQVHQSLRLFIIRTPIPSSDNTYQRGPIKIFINPKLSEPSSETWEVAEGCLSIPTIRAPVERPKEVTVEYTTLDGQTIRERVSSWEARVIQHEYDHLEGILYFDRLDEEEKKKLLPLLQSVKKRIWKGVAASPNP